MKPAGAAAAKQSARMLEKRQRLQASTNERIKPIGGANDERHLQLFHPTSATDVSYSIYL